MGRNGQALGPPPGWVRGQGPAQKETLVQKLRTLKRLRGGCQSLTLCSCVS